MAVILTPGCAEIRLVGSQEGMQFINIFHAETPLGSSPIAAGDLAALLAAVSGASAMLADYAALLPSTATISEVSVRDVGAAGAISSVAPLSVVGTGSGDCQNSASAAVCIGNIGAVYGFKKPPRIFFPAVLDANSTNNTLVSGAITGYNALAAAIMAAINGAAATGGTWKMVLRSLYFGSGGGTPGHPIPHPRATGITTPVLSWATRPKVGTRVDRLRGGRRHR